MSVQNLLSMVKCHLILMHAIYHRLHYPFIGSLLIFNLTLVLCRYMFSEKINSPNICIIGKMQKRKCLCLTKHPINLSLAVLIFVKKFQEYSVVT